MNLKVGDVLAFLPTMVEREVKYAKDGYIKVPRLTKNYRYDYSLTMYSWLERGRFIKVDKNKSDWVEEIKKNFNENRKKEIEVI